MTSRGDDDADDLRLLRRYARERDERAFAEVVRRHVGMVYAAAVRRVGDRHRAEDVTQAVFVILAKKANSMNADRPLSLWLLTTVRYCAANAVRIEARRRRRERSDDAALAGAADTTGSCSSNPTDVLIWQEVASRLDDAVLKLSPPDRRAVLLRFFEDRQMSEIAADLNVTETTARQRVSRAVAKLRQRLDRHGAGGLALCGAAGLERLLEAHLLRASAHAPPGLANAACAAATTGVASGASLTIAKGAIHMMTLAKTKLVAAAAAVAVVVGIGGMSLINRADAQDQRQAAPARQVAQNLALAPATPLLAAAPAAAPARDKPAKDESKPRGGITGVESAPPVVVKTVPQAGADDVDPGLKEIRVTFSKAMTDGNWSFPQVSKETAIKSTGKPHFEDEQRTCVLPVQLEPGKTYVIPINKPPFNSFMDKDSRRAMEYLLVFETKKE